MNITVLYIFIDDFIKEFMTVKQWQTLKPLWKGSRRPQKKLSLSEVVPLNIFRFHYRIADSTPLPVCHNHNIYSHKMNREIAQRGKSTKGWLTDSKPGDLNRETGTSIKYRTMDYFRELVRDTGREVTAKADCPLCYCIRLQKQ